jgi:predicted  nucleic acid-binding Zn-ribbon protein
MSRLRETAPAPVTPPDRPWRAWSDTLSRVLDASLSALVALQGLDSARDAAQRRLTELPAAEQASEARVAEATAVLEAETTRLADNQHARRQLEKDVAAVDTRLARFDDHKAAVKTNQEYTALLHEIATAKAEKDAIEERILLQMEEADTLSAAVKAAEAALAAARADHQTMRTALAAERTSLEAEIARLGGERANQGPARHRRRADDGRRL